MIPAVAGTVASSFVRGFSNRQGAHTKGTLNAQTGTGKTYNGLPFSSNVLAGSLLVLSIAYDSGATITGVSGGGTWSRMGTPQTDATNSETCETWYCPNATGGATTPVITYNSASSGFGGAALVIAEFTGVKTTAPLDTSNTAKAFAASSTTANGNTSNSITPAGAGELIIAIYLGTAGAAPTITAGTGYTIAVNEPGTAAVTGTAVLEWKTGTAGATTGTFTSNTNTDRYTVQIGAFLSA